MIYGSWDINCNRQIFFCHLGPLFELWKYHKNQNNPWRYNILHKCTKNHDHRLYCSWDMAHDGCNCYFHFGLFFAILPPNSPKNENFKKMKKMLADIIIIHKRTKTRDHMLYCYWDMVRDRCNCYFWFWPIFCPFTPLTAWKTKIKKKKKEKKPWRYHHFTQVYQKSWLYAIPFLRYGAWRMSLLFFILGYFLPFYPPYSPKNQNFKIMKKAPENIIILYECHKTHDHMFLRYGAWHM